MKKAVILFLAVLFFTGNAYAETDCIPSSVSNEGIILALDEIGVIPSATQEENEPEIIPPFIPEGMQKTNFGTDDRITVSGDQLFAFPFSCIAMLEMEFDISKKKLLVKSLLISSEELKISFFIYSIINRSV